MRTNDMSTDDLSRVTSPARGRGRAGGNARAAPSRGLPLSYVVRSLWVRKVTTALTAASMALVVFVFAAVLMMSNGIRDALASTGTAGNVMVMRKGAGAEINSLIARDDAAVIASLPDIARDGTGQARAVSESVVLNSLRKRDRVALGNVTVRGTTAAALPLRPQVHLAQGRMFRAGTSEIVAGVAAARGFADLELGQSVHFAGRDWQVVGILDSAGSGFDSEVWADVSQVMQAFRRDAYSVVLFALGNTDRLAAACAALVADGRLSVEAKSETAFYAEQSEQMARFIRLLGLSLSLIFSTGATAGAMITMLAAVASRTAEIGTLRALGFQRRAVVTAFVGESMALALVGGAGGTLAALSLTELNVSTTNIQTFSELAFRFKMDAGIAAAAMAFAVVMGLIGGVLPAWRAARLGIVDALRSR